jgi:hypothetical protein
MRRERAASLTTQRQFGGITLAPDGRELTLDYSEAPEPGAERFFHYVFSLQARPKLVTGISRHSIDAERDIAYSEVPSEVIRDACSWLESNIAIAAERQNKSLSGILTEYLAALKGQHSSSGR